MLMRKLARGGNGSKAVCYLRTGEDLNLGRNIEPEKTITVNRPATSTAVQPVATETVHQIPSTAMPHPMKRLPGRPPGTKNKNAAVLTSQPPKKRPPDRPPGTKNQKPLPKKSKTIAISCSQGTSRKQAGKTRRRTSIKWLELSITISVAGSDVSPRIFPAVQNFLERECVAGIFAVERAGSLLHLHLQGVIAIFYTSLMDVKKRITAAIDWTENRPVGACVYVKKLTNKGIHTFVGMVGYCLKDRQELHFCVCMKEISDVMQREGMLLYTFYGAADMKNRIELNPSNIRQRALQYNKYVSHHPLGTSFHGCIRRMLVGGHYTPSTSWLINRGMDLTRMCSLWKAYVQPGSITMADMKNIFFWLPRQCLSRFIEGVHPDLQLLKTNVLEDMRDSDNHDSDQSPFHGERLSGNAVAHDISEFASFIPLVPGLAEAGADSSDPPLEGISSNCLCC